MIKKAGRLFIIAVVIVALWKVFGGDPGKAITTVLDAVVGWVDSVSDWVVGLDFFQKLFS